MSRVQKRLMFKTRNLNAFLLAGADPVTFDYTINTIDFDEQVCEVESISYSGGADVQVTLKPRADTWFSADASVGINTDLTWSANGNQEGNIPSYRYKMAADATNSTTIYLNSHSGDDDERALQPGNTLWYMNTSSSTEVYWKTVSNTSGSSRNWHYLGVIDTVDVLSSSIKVVLKSINYSSTMTTNYIVQCQPKASHFQTKKTDGSGSATVTWHIKAELNFGEEWDFAVGSDSGAYSIDGGANYTDETLRWADGLQYMTTEAETPGITSDYSANNYPGALRFYIRTQNGVIGTEYVYVFSETLSVSKGDATTITDVDVDMKGRPWSDFTGEGFLVGTEWDSADNPNVKCFIEYDQGTSFVSSEGNIYGDSSNLQPMFQELLFKESTDGSFVFADDVAFDDSITLKMHVYDSDDAPLGTSELTLDKVNRLFDNYLATINKYDDGTNDYRGAGFLVATSLWSKFSPNWDTDVSSGEQKWAGGMYLYATPPTTHTDLTTWRHKGIYWTGTKWVFDVNGPSFAAEVDGDTKLSYGNTAGNYLFGTVQERGVLFYTFNGYDDGTDTEKTIRGEMLFGLDKTITRALYVSSSSANSRYLLSTPASTGSIKGNWFDSGVGSDSDKWNLGHRGAAVIIKRSLSGDSSIYKPNVFISNLAVHGLLISGNPRTPTSSALLYGDDPTDTTTPAILMFTADDDIYPGSGFGYDTLCGYNTGGGSGGWMGYAFMSEAGQLCLPTPKGTWASPANYLSLRGVSYASGTNYMNTKYTPIFSSSSGYVFQNAYQDKLDVPTVSSAPASGDAACIYVDSSGNLRFWDGTKTNTVTTTTP